MKTTLTLEMTSKGHLRVMLNTAARLLPNLVKHLWWWHGVMVNALVMINISYSTPGPVSTWMGDRLQKGKPSRYVASHPGQLSLAIPPWVGAMSNFATFTHPSSI